MTVNCANIGREEESLNIANINLLVRFNKIREEKYFPVLLEF